MRFSPAALTTVLAKSLKVDNRRVVDSLLITEAVKTPVEELLRISISPEDFAALENVGDLFEYLEDFE